MIVLVLWIEPNRFVNQEEGTRRIAQKAPVSGPGKGGVCRVIKAACQLDHVIESILSDRFPNLLGDGNVWDAAADLWILSFESIKIR